MKGQEEIEKLKSDIPQLNKVDNSEIRNIIAYLLYLSHLRKRS